MLSQAALVYSVYEILIEGILQSEIQVNSRTESRDEMQAKRKPSVRL